VQNCIPTIILNQTPIKIIGDDLLILDKKEGTMSDPTMDLLVKALLDGDQAGALAETRKLRDAGVERERIVTEGMEAAMTQLDDKCTVAQFNLLEIMLVGRAVMTVLKELYPPMDPPPGTMGTVVLGTLEGDIHDLGKNVLKAVLTAGRYRVVDCGKDCPVETMIDAAEREAALAVAVSGLITTVIPQVRLLRDRMIGRGLGHIKVMAGGAALKQSSAESLNVDFVADTAFDGLHYLRQINGGEK
jgi:dimethylamine corrinoid protein